MERRTFLSTVASTAAGVAAAPITSTLSAMPSVPAEPPPLAAVPDMDEYVARVDRGVARIGAWSPGANARAARDGVDVDTLARNSLQAMFLTGMLGDLPLPAQLDERMQDRVARAMPVLDDAVSGMTDFLATRTEADLAAVQAELQSPGVAREIRNALVSEAAASGVSPQRRAQLEGMVDHVTWRMANQPPALIVSEYLEKVEKVAATDVESEVRQRQLAARVGEELFWQQAQPSLRDRRIRRGAKVLGYGAITLAIGTGIVAAGAFPGVFVMTAGVVTLIVGLIMLLIGYSTRRDPAAPAAPSTR